MTQTPGDGASPEEPQHPYGQAVRPPSQQPGQPPYGPPGPPGYGPPPGYPPAGYAPDHPKATTSLVLGILGLVLCQVLSPFAWRMGKQTVAEIDASYGRMGGRGAAQAGYITGLIGTILLIIALVFVLLYVVILVIALSTGAMG